MSRRAKQDEPSEVEQSESRQAKLRPAKGTQSEVKTDERQSSADGRATIEQEEQQQSSPGQQSRTTKQDREDRTDKREEKTTRVNNQPTLIMFCLDVWYKEYI